MRICNVDGRIALGINDTEFVDVANASKGVFGPSAQEVFAKWQEFIDWAKRYKGIDDIFVPSQSQICAPIPQPSQVFAIGLNYRMHAIEFSLPIPEIPVVFTKFPASVTGPYDTVTLPPGNVDYETEMVVVIGKRAERVKAESAWEYVAGLTIGQDLSERKQQWAGTAPQQFSLGKSFAGFAPIGPVLVTPDEFADPNNVKISCRLNDKEMQNSSTDDLIFSVADLIEYLSAITPLLPGDLIFTGTPSGVGAVLNPPVFIQPGDVLETFAECIGSMRHTFVARDDRN